MSSQKSENKSFSSSYIGTSLETIKRIIKEELAVANKELREAMATDSQERKEFFITFDGMLSAIDKLVPLFDHGTLPGTTTLVKYSFELNELIEKIKNLKDKFRVIDLNHPAFYKLLTKIFDLIIEAPNKFEDCFKFLAEPEKLVELNIGFLKWAINFKKDLGVTTYDAQKAEKRGSKYYFGKSTISKKGETDFQLFYEQRRAESILSIVLYSIFRDHEKVAINLPVPEPHLITNFLFSHPDVITLVRANTIFSETAKKINDYHTAICNFNEVITEITSSKDSEEERTNKLLDLMSQLDKLAKFRDENILYPYYFIIEDEKAYFKHTQLELYFLNQIIRNLRDYLTNECSNLLKDIKVDFDTVLEVSVEGIKTIDEMLNKIIELEDKDAYLQSLLSPVSSLIGCLDKPMNEEDSLIEDSCKERLNELSAKMGELKRKKELADLAEKMKSLNKEAFQARSEILRREKHSLDADIKRATEIIDAEQKSIDVRKSECEYRKKVFIINLEQVNELLMTPSLKHIIKIIAAIDYQQVKDKKLDLLAVNIDTLKKLNELCKKSLPNSVTDADLKQFKVTHYFEQYEAYFKQYIETFIFIKSLIDNKENEKQNRRQTAKKLPYAEKVDEVSALLSGIIGKLDSQTASEVFAELMKLMGKIQGSWTENGYLKDFFKIIDEPILTRESRSEFIKALTEEKYKLGLKKAIFQKIVIYEFYRSEVQKKNSSITFSTTLAPLKALDKHYDDASVLKELPSKSKKSKLNHLDPLAGLYNDYVAEYNCIEELEGQLAEKSKDIESKKTRLHQVEIEQKVIAILMKFTKDNKKLGEMFNDPLAAKDMDGLERQLKALNVIGRLKELLPVTDAYEKAFDVVEANYKTHLKYLITRKKILLAEEIAQVKVSEFATFQQLKDITEPLARLHKKYTSLPGVSSLEENLKCNSAFEAKRHELSTIVEQYLQNIFGVFEKQKENVRQARFALVDEYLAQPLINHEAFFGILDKVKDLPDFELNGYKKRWKSFVEEYETLKQNLHQLKRQSIAKTYESELNQYIVQRTNRFSFKDRFFNGDKIKREALVKELLPLLNAYGGNDGDLTSLTEKIENGIKKHSGIYLQPLLKRLTCDIQCLALNTIDKDKLDNQLANLPKKLRSNIAKLYGQTELLRKEGVRLAKEEIYNKRAEKLSQIIGNFVMSLNTDSDNLTIPVTTLNQFKKDMCYQLTSEMDLMRNEESRVGLQIIINIIAALVIFIPVALRLIYTKHSEKHGHAKFFFSGNSVLDKVSSIEESTNSLIDDIRTQFAEPQAIIVN